jgi:hypothetical protein
LHTLWQSSGRALKEPSPKSKSTTINVEPEEYNVRIYNCSGSSGLEGYNSIAEINMDMEDELDRIYAGGYYYSSYKFLLCPEQIFNVTEPLLPVLSNSIFWCGDDGQVQSECIFSGGVQQVFLRDSTNASYTIDQVSLFGITFEGFTQQAIAGDASSTLKLNVERSSFSVSLPN